MALPGVTGTGIGAGDAPGSYAIVVYLESPAPEPPGSPEIEGVQVKYIVTGRIRPQ